MRFSTKILVIISIFGLLIITGCGLTINQGQTDVGLSGKSSSLPCKNGPLAKYISGKGEYLIVCFDNIKNTATVKRPDGQVITLPVAISASGARYSDTKETFWEHHGQASYWIGDTLIYQGKALDNNLTK